MNEYQTDGNSCKRKMVHEMMTYGESFLSTSTSSSCSADASTVAVAQEMRADQLVSMHEWQPAIEAYFSALRSSMFAFGENSLRTAVLYDKIGNVFLRLKDFHSAIKSFKDALEKFRILLLPGDPRIISCVYNLARSHAALGDNTSMVTALNIYNHCVMIQRSCITRDLLMEARTITAIAQIHEKMQQYGLAMRCFEEVLDLKTGVLGDKHFDISTTLFSLASIHFEQEENELAILSFKECLAIRREHNCNPEDVSSVLFNIAAISAEICDMVEAKKYFKEAIDVELTNHRRRTNTLMKSYHHLARVHVTLGDLDDAITCSVECVNLSFMDDDVPVTQRIQYLKQVGNLYLQKGNVVKAREYLDKCQELEGKQTIGAKPVSARAA